MISKNLASKLNEQMNMEFASAYAYLAMSNDAKTKELGGTSHWMFSQYKEELDHAFKINKYLLEQGETPEFEAVSKPKATFTDLEEMLVATMSHEVAVTKAINNLMSIAHEEKDYASIAFLNWFVLEQVEEEDVVRGLIERFRMYPKAHLLLFDTHLGQRV